MREEKSKTMNNENIKMISENKHSADPNFSLVFFLLLLLRIVVRFRALRMFLMGGAYCSVCWRIYDEDNKYVWRANNTF